MDTIDLEGIVDEPFADNKRERALFLRKAKLAASPLDLTILDDIEDALPLTPPDCPAPDCEIRNDTPPPDDPPYTGDLQGQIAELQAQVAELARRVQALEQRQAAAGPGTVYGPTNSGTPLLPSGDRQ